MRRSARIEQKEGRNLAAEPEHSGKCSSENDEPEISKKVLGLNKRKRSTAVVEKENVENTQKTRKVAKRVRKGELSDKVVTDVILSKSCPGKQTSNQLTALQLQVMVDKHVPDASTYSVVPNKDSSSLPYNAMLNQTNLGLNNNKYFLLQVIQSKVTGTSFRYATFFRWGRVGYEGQKNLVRAQSLDKAIHEFEKKFKEKTFNDWENVAKSPELFDTCTGKYTFIETAPPMIRSREDDGNVNCPSTPSEDENGDVSSLLCEQLTSFVKLICNRKLMQQSLTVSYGYDLNKMPLGKLSQSVIHQAYKTLQDIELVLLSTTTTKDKKKGCQSSLTNLCSKFFTLIPHNIGFQNVRGFMINTIDVLREKVELLGSLSEALTAETEVFKGPGRVSVRVLYDRLSVSLVPLSEDDDDWRIIQMYSKNTIGPTHSNTTTYSIKNIFKLQRDIDNDIHHHLHAQQNQEDKSSGSKPLLLWHGSRLTNWPSILKNGLKIAPPEAPVTGYMFGKGIYFSDCFSKSANYSKPSLLSSEEVVDSDNRKRGVICLCSVELGNSLRLYHSDSKLPGSRKVGLHPSVYNSVLAMGKYEPSSSLSSNVLLQSCQVPCGPIDLRENKDELENATGLLYNEFIVYDISQVEIKYVVEVDFDDSTSQMF